MNRTEDLRVFALVGFHESNQAVRCLQILPLKVKLFVATVSKKIEEFDLTS